MMFGFALKDLLVMRKNITYYVVFLVVYGFLSATGVFPYSVLAGLVVLVGLMLPMSSFAYDDQARWEKFAAVTPAGRRGVVQGKYLFTLLCTAAAAVLVGAILTVMALLGAVDAEVWWEPLAVVAACACITLLLDSVFLPFLLKFGSEKARMLTMLVFVVVFGGMALLVYLTEHGWHFSAPSPLFVTLAPILLAAVTAAAFAGSYAVSLGIYGKKEL